MTKTGLGATKWFPTHPRPVVGVCLLGILLLGGIVRSSQIHESLWLDELHTSWVVAGTAPQLPARARAGNQSPLYFYMEQAVVRLFGASEPSLRLVSQLAGIALIVAVYAVVCRWTGWVGAGLLAALLVAVNRDCVFYAQEARPYACVQLFAVLHAWLLMGVYERPTIGRRSLLVAGAVWLFYLHYTAVLFLMAECVYVCIRFAAARRRPSYRPIQFLVDVAVLALAMLPAVPHLLEISARRANWTRMIDVWPSPALSMTFWILVAFPIGCMAAGRLIRLEPCKRQACSGAQAWIACWVAIPAATAWLSTWSGLAALWMLRYLVASLAGAIVLAGVCHAQYTNRWYRSLFAVGILAATICGGGMVQQWSRDGRWIGDRREDWRSAVVWLNHQWQSAPAPVFLAAGLLEDRALYSSHDAALHEYCLFPVRGLYRLAVTHVEAIPTQRHLRLNRSQQALVRDRGNAWLVLRARPAVAEIMTESVLQMWTTGDMKAEVFASRQFGNVAVVGVAVESENAAGTRSVK